MSEPHEWFEHGFEPRYRFLRELGRGGMGIVRLYEDTVLERRVAIKLLPEHIITDARARDRFLNEARAAARLNQDLADHRADIDAVLDRNGREAPLLPEGDPGPRRHRALGFFGRRCRQPFFHDKQPFFP